MKKFLKILGISLFVIISILIAIPFIFSGKIKEIVVEEINKNVDAQVDFADIELSIFAGFPDLRMTLSQLSVIGKNKFEGDTLIAFDAFVADINVLSLLSNSIAVNSIVLNKPTINGIVLRDNTANWDIAPPSEATTEEAPDTTATPPYVLKLKEFRIVDATINYTDETSDMQAQINNLNYSLNGDLSASFTTIAHLLQIESLSFSMSGIKYLNRAKIKFEAGMDADLEKMLFTFKDNVFSLNELQFGFAGNIEMPTDDISLDLIFDLKQTDFKSLLSLIPVIYMNDYQGLKADGSLAFNGYVKGTLTDTKIPGYGINLKVENARFNYPDLPKSVENVQIDVQVKGLGGSGDVNNININTFHVEMANNPFDVKMLIQTDANDISLDGNFAGTINLSSVKEIVPLEGMDLNGIITTDINLKGNLSAIEKEEYEKFTADGNLTIENLKYSMEGIPAVHIIASQTAFSPQYVQLSSFDATIGKSDISMTGRLENFIPFALKDAVLKGELNLNSKYLDVNEFLTGEESPQEPVETDTVPLTAIEIPQNIDFKLKSDLKKVLYDNMNIDNILGLIEMKDGKLSLTNLEMNILGGEMKMNGSYEATNPQKPLADFTLDITDFSIPESFKTFNTIQKLAPIAENCIGNFSTGLQIKTDLDFYMNPDLASINGAGKLSSKSIGLQSSKFFAMLYENTKIEAFNNPVLNNINIDFTIENGTITIKPFTMKVGNNVAEISGTQKLDQTINYLINTKIPFEKASKLITNLGLNNNISEVDAIINVGGTITEPKILSVNSNAGEQIQEQIEEKIQEVVTETKKALKEKADKIIAAAEIQAAKIIAEAEKQAETIRKAAKTAGDAAIAEADTQGKKAIKEAGSNPIAKKAAEVSAKKLNEEAAKKAAKLNSEADTKAKTLISNAQKQAENIRKNAQKQADDLLKT